MRGWPGFCDKGSAGAGLPAARTKPAMLTNRMTARTIGDFSCSKPNATPCLHCTSDGVKGRVELVLRPDCLHFTHTADGVAIAMRFVDFTKAVVPGTRG